MHLCQIKNKISDNRIDVIRYAFFGAMAFFITTFCSMCSFLFPLHNRVDQNIFFTIGREMLEGKDVYTDLFDHKGTYTYLMHEFAAVFSTESMIGIFFIELIFMFVYILFLYKIANLYLKPLPSVLVAVITAALTSTTRCFLRGNNNEEFVYVFLVITLYYMLKEDIPGNKTLILNGAFVAFALWYKFTLLGFWIGWALVTYIPMLINKEWKRFFKSVGMFLIGFGALTAPVFIYHLIKGNVIDFLYTYIYCNVFLYAKELSVWDRVIKIIESVGRNFDENKVLLIVFFCGIVGFFANNKYVKKLAKRLSVLVCFLIAYVLIYWGGVWYDYYLLVLAPFAVFGVIAIIGFLLDFNKVGVLLKKFRIAVAAVILVCVMCATVLFSNCFPYLGKADTEYAQIKFANKIDEICESNNIDDPTLLNYGFIDQGFYLAADIRPINKYFCRVNIPKEALPEMYDEQNSMLKNQKVDFVVTRTTQKHVASEYKHDILQENYEFVCEADDIHDNYRYGLWVKKN